MDSGCDQAYEPAALLLGIPSGRKPADRTSSAPAQHAEVLFKVYSSIVHWWASVRVFPGGRIRRHCLRIRARNRIIWPKVGLEPTTLRLTAECSGLPTFF